jgi:hypothetical protein
MPNNDDLDIGGSGEFTPYLKYNSKSNQWSWRGEDGEVQLASPVFAMDLTNIQTAWLRFDEGAAPDRLIDGADGRAPRPSNRHKRGFIVRVFSRQSFHGVGEFSSNAIGVCNALKELHQTYRSQAAEHRGQVPVVHVVGTSTFKGRFGSNFAPAFAIKAWVQRPDVMPDEPLFPVNPGKGNGAGTMKPEPVTAGEKAAQAAQAPISAMADLDDDIPF